MMSSAATLVGKHSGHRESHSGLGRKPFAFPSESLFAFSPESRSPSPRNAFHVHPGILFAFARNPQQQPSSLSESAYSKNRRWLHRQADFTDFQDFMERFQAPA